MKPTLTEQKMLEQILERARKIAGCEEIATVGIFKVVEPGGANWSVNVVGGVDGRAGGERVQQIIEELAAHYDIQWPTEQFDLSHGATVFAECDMPGRAARLYGATLLEAVRWARAQKPELRYSVWLHEPGKEPRPLMVEELTWLFRQVP